MGSWKGCALPSHFIWKDGLYKIPGVWFSPDLQLEKNCSEVLEKVVAATELWLCWWLSLKGRAEVCCSHIYSLVIYWLSVLPILCTILFKLERILFQFFWAKRFPLVRQEICYLHLSESSLGVLNVEMQCLTFLDQMCSQDTVAGCFWKEDAKQSFPSLWSVHSSDRETHRVPRRECPFYRKCRHALKVLSRLQTGLSNSRPLLSRAYRCLVRGATSDDLISELVVTVEEGRLLWLWAPGMRCLNNDKASFTWLVIRNALWVSKKLFSAQLAISPVWWFGGVYWPRWLCSRCASFLKVTWFASWMESTSSWKPVLCAAMWYWSWTDRNIMCFSAYAALCVSWFGQWERRNSTTMSLFLLRPWWPFINTKLKSKSSLRERDSLCWSLAKGRWLLRACVMW